jgi:hypothetical protein
MIILIFIKKLYYILNNSLKTLIIHSDPLIILFLLEFLTKKNKSDECFISNISCVV